MNERSRRPTVIDAHVHVASTHFVPRRFVEGAARNMAVKTGRRGAAVSPGQALSLLEAQHQDHCADQLVASMDEAGVARAVLLLPDFTRVLPCERSIDEMAEEHHRIRLRHPGRFHVFMGADPHKGRESLDLFERAVASYGFEGLKLYPPCGYSPSDERLFPFYEICRARHLPVLIHTGPTSPVLSFEYSSPLCVDRAAAQFGDVNFILAHGGVNHVHEAVLMCAYRPNVFLDFSGFTSALHPGGWSRQLEELFRLNINHKVIFGTDWPLSRLTGTHQGLLELLLAPSGPLAGRREYEIEAIMHGNIERLLQHAPASALPGEH